VFDQARDRFLSSLSPQDRLLFSPCATSKDFLDAVTKLDALSKKQAQGAMRLRRIRSAADKLQPYFEVVNIFVQSNPQYSAIVWGAIRLVLQVGELWNSKSSVLTLIVACEQFDYVLRQTHLSSRSDI
jgi:hypothetical protein